MINQNHISFSERKTSMRSPFPHSFIPKFLAILLFILLPTATFCAKPITIIVNLTPPYTPFLNEYGTIGIDKLQVTLIVNDNRMINYPAKIQMFVERIGSGVVMRTGEYASIPPVFLTGGSTEIFSGADLASFFRAGNNVFSGFDQTQYQFTGRIPDGQYRIGFQVVDAQRSEVILSNTAYTQPAWFVLNDVPQLNLPRNHSEERVNDIQNVKLEWFPRHLGSMNSAFPVSYQVELFAIRVPGMEPNIVALSAVPDFTDVTNQNKYILSSDKYMLEPGVEYAWRVKAITDEGLTLFVNNGFSEVNSFVYGSLCPVPLNTLARIYGSDKAFISWNGDPLHTSYETRIRAHQAENPVWHTFKGFDNSLEINQILRANTTYDYQVRAVCLTTQSDYTPIDTFRTTRQANENFECGADDTVIVTNKVPKGILRAGEYIYNGQFPVKLTTISGSNGIFTGTGRLRIPFLKNIQVCVKFASIRVNELNEVYEGKMITVYNPNSRFYMDDITDVWSVGDQVGNVITGLDSAAIHLNYAVNDVSDLNVSFNGNTVTVNGAATTITTSTGGTTISDSKGNIYAVDEGGNATQVGVSGGTNNTDYAANAGEYNKLNDEMQIVFSDYESDLWAFDTWRAEYEGKQLIASEYEDLNGYKVPWKLIPAGKSGTVKVNTLKGDIDLDKVVFKTPTGTQYYLKDGKLTMIGGKTGDVQEIYALYPKGDSLISIGKLKVATYEMLVRKMMLVPVGEQKVDLEGIAANVNKAWLPYGVEWKVTLDAAFTDISWDENKDGKLEAGESGFFSMYSSEMNKLNTAYQTSRSASEDILYIFVFGQEAQNSGNKELLGDMPLSSQFGYIFKPANDEISHKTIAHEAGHGFFQLKHTFNEDYSLVDNDNMMDYSDGTYLFKQQWDAIHDPALMLFSFLQDEEEGAMMAVQSYFSLKVDNEIYDCFTKQEVDEISKNMVEGKQPETKEKDIYFIGGIPLSLKACAGKPNKKMEIKGADEVTWKNDGVNTEINKDAENNITVSLNDKETSVVAYFKYYFTASYGQSYNIEIPYRVNFIAVMPELYFNENEDVNSPTEQKIKGLTCNTYGVKEIQLLPKFIRYEHWQARQITPNASISELIKAKELIKEIKWNGTTIETTDFKGWNKYLIDQGKENSLEITPKLGQAITFKIRPKTAPTVSMVRDDLSIKDNYSIDDYELYRNDDKKGYSSSYESISIEGQTYYTPFINYVSSAGEIEIRIKPTGTVSIDGLCRYVVEYPDAKTEKILVKENSGLGFVTGFWGALKFTLPDDGGYVSIKDELGNVKGKINLVSCQINTSTKTYTAKLVKLVYGSASSTITDIKDFEDKLKKTYNTVGVGWNVDPAILTVNLNDADIPATGYTIQKSGGGYLTLTKDEIKELLKSNAITGEQEQNYEILINHIYDKILSKKLALLGTVEYYVLLLHNNITQVNGFAGVGKKYCFLSSDFGERTPSHELGHCLGLDEVAIDLGSCTNDNVRNCNTQVNSSNIMGYGGGWDLYIWQINKIK